jgi:sec-independent protein translocase protein TatA
MLGLGTGEIIAIVLVVFLLFGATRLPQLARSLGQSRKAFKDAMREAAEDDDKAAVPNAQIDTKPVAGDLSTMSDEEIMTEMRRRATSGQKG